MEQIKNFIQKQSYETEVWIVENGSTDLTYQIAVEQSKNHPNIHVHHEDARGKGLAVRSGMLKAKGDYRFFCDVDFSMPIEEINRFLPPNLLNADIAIASRETPGAIRYHEPVYRHLTGRIFNTLVRWLILPGLHDTQCGFKCFRAEVAERVFRLQTLPGWSFDAEVLFIARRLGYTIKEVPISWYYNPDSRVRLLRDSFHMAQDMLKIRQNARQGIYDRS